jgi:hypothetical protein
MTLDTARNVAQFVLDTLEASGGTFDYSRFYARGDAFLEEMKITTFWMFDVAIGALEAAGIVATETLDNPLGDDTYDYRITLVGNPTMPAFSVAKGVVWVEQADMPSGFKYLEQTP